MTFLRKSETTTTSAPVEEPFDKLHVDHTRNHRKDYGSDDEFFSFMADVGRRGVDTNLLCEDNKDEVKPYAVLAGFRRSKSIETIRLLHAIAKMKTVAQDDYTQILEAEGPAAATAVKQEWEIKLSTTFGNDKLDYFEKWAFQTIYRDNISEEEKKDEGEGIVYGLEAVMWFYNIASLDEEARGVGKVDPTKMSHYLKALDRWVTKTNVVPLRVKRGSAAALELDSLLENLQRKDLNALEQSEAFLRIIENITNDGKMKKTNAKQYLARKIGRSSSFIDQRLRLMTDLIPEAREALLKKEIAETQAYVISLGPELKQLTYLEKAKAGSTTGALRRLICSDKEADPSPVSKRGRKVVVRESNEIASRCSLSTAVTTTKGDKSLAPAFVADVGKHTLGFSQVDKANNRFVISIDGEDRVHVKTTPAGYVKLSSPSGGSVLDVLSVKTAGVRVVITRDTTCDGRFSIEVDEVLRGALYVHGDGSLYVEQEDGDVSVDKVIDDDDDDDDTSDEDLVKGLLDTADEDEVYDEEEEEEDIPYVPNPNGTPW